MEIPVQQVFSELIEQAEAPMVVSLDLEYSDGATSPVRLTAVLQGKDRERVSRALEGSRSANTRKSYARGWTAFERWCLEKGTSSMPADPEFIAAYLAERAESGWKISTIRVAWAAISDAHRQAGHPDVAEHLGIRRTISGLARGDRRPQRQAQGLTSEASDSGHRLQPSARGWTRQPGRERGGCPTPGIGGHSNLLRPQGRDAPQERTGSTMLGRR